MNELVTTKAGLYSLIALITYLGTRFSDMFWILCMLMFIDYLSGYIHAWMSKTRNSRIGLIGILKKIMYVVFVVFGFILDMALIRILNRLNIDFKFDDIGGISLGTVIIMFYIGNETISIVENFEKMGLKVPTWLISVGNLFKAIPAAVVKLLVKKGEEYIEDCEDEANDNKEQSNNIKSSDNS